MKETKKKGGKTYINNLRFSPFFPWLIFHFCPFMVFAARFLLVFCLIIHMKSPSQIPWGQREKMERRKSVK